MTTPQSQVGSIDTPELLALMAAWGECEPGDEAANLYDSIVAHIDANLAQAHQIGYEDAFNTFVASNVKFKERAEKAESRLAEIQRGVEGLQRYEFRTGFKLDVPAAGILPTELGPYVMFEAVENLLDPQVQSDTSGLPG